jgi:hypothetical protein
MIKLKHIATAALIAVSLAGSAQAACYADYKAKRDNPLRLHYGVIELPDSVCGKKKNARQEIAKRIAADNWKLLNVLSFFGAEGLENRKESAGEFFLRY